jgi:hypothetical protein
VHFWFKASAGRCSDRVAVTVMPGHDRHILIFPSDTRITLIDARHWIAGVLPDGVGGVILASPLGRPYDAAMIDDGCYYFEYVRSGKYVLRFLISPGLPLDVPEIVDSTNESGQITNLTLDQIMKTLNARH